METKEKLIQRKRYGRTVQFHPKYVKRAAVKEIESGELTIEQVMEKYQITGRRCIIDWLRLYSQLEVSEYSTKRTPIDLRRKVIYEIDTGLLTPLQAARKYHVARSTINNWEKLYSCNVNRNIKMQETPISPPQLENSNPKQDRHEPDILKLKIAALETMIGLAEKEFNIDIRKKFGTKQ